MNETNKERTRRLIGLGGLVSIAGLDTLNKGELLGLLIHMLWVHKKLTPEDRLALRQSGWSVLKQRKEQRSVKKTTAKEPEDQVNGV